MTTQLAFFETTAEDPNVRWLEAMLQRHQQWSTAADICQHAGWPASDNNKRRIRAWANASQMIVSGQPGYRHIDYCTSDELRHFTSWMESQAKKMTQRAEAMRRRAHQRIG